MSGVERVEGAGSFEREARDAAVMVAHLKSLGFFILDPADLEAAAERTLPVVCSLGRSVLLISDLATKAVALGMRRDAAAALGEAALSLMTFINAVERREIMVAAVTLPTVGGAL